MLAWLLCLSIAASAPRLDLFRQDLPREKFSAAIEDNSFLIEEAYNQERRVVQHITGALINRRPTQDLLLNFTQEWPAFGPRHQLSYSVSYNRLDGGAISGLNDILINYRYQLFDEERWAAVAPRLSIILPMGSASKGLGNGAPGVQVCWPASKRFSERFATHWNVGFTFVPRAKGSDADQGTVRRDLLSYFYGASLIFLAHPNFNLMLEWITIDNAEFDGSGNVVRRTETIVNPGLRLAVNLGRLQIVPGLAVPIRWSRGKTRVGIFLYLSFEHPY